MPGLGEAGVVDLDQPLGEQEWHRLAFGGIGERAELDFVLDQARIDAVGHDLQPQVQPLDRSDDVGRHPRQAGDAGQLLFGETAANERHGRRHGQAHARIYGRHVRQGLQGLDRGVVERPQPGRAAARTVPPTRRRRRSPRLHPS